MKKIFVLALAALLVVPAMAQTNKEAIKAAEKQVQEKQKELADAQRKRKASSRLTCCPSRWSFPRSSMSRERRIFP